MMKLLLPVLALCLTVESQSVVKRQIDNNNHKNVLCYYTNWSPGRPGKAKFTPKNIHPHICTHLLYAFAGFSKDGMRIASVNEDADIVKGGFKEFVSLKRVNENLKVLIALGGSGEGARRYSNAAASTENRTIFVDSIVEFVKTHGFDGINLDWQFPGDREGSRNEDKENYVELVKALREAFTRETEGSSLEPWIIAIGAPSETEVAERGYKLAELTKYVDFLNVVTYDYHKSTDVFVHNHAPLYPLREELDPSNTNYRLNVDYTISWYIENGAPPTQINFGIPTYGRTYTLEEPDQNSIGSPAIGEGNAGPFTGEDGHLAYYEICDMLQQPNTDWIIRYPNKTAMGPYAFKGDQWVGFDDEDTIRRKGMYACQRNLGGIMFWTIDFDDFNAECHPLSNPLIRAASEAFRSCRKERSPNMNERVDGTPAPPVQVTVTPARPRPTPPPPPPPLSPARQPQQSAPRQQPAVAAQPQTAVPLPQIIRQLTPNNLVQAPARNMPAETQYSSVSSDPSSDVTSYFPIVIRPQDLKSDDPSKITYFFQNLRVFVKNNVFHLNSKSKK